jgi:transposase
MGVKNPKSYSQEYRDEAVKLSEELGTTGAARQLGISISNIHTWRGKIKSPNGSGEKPGQSKAASFLEMEEENRRLRKENGNLKKTNEMLKAVTAFFSQDHLK